MKQSINLRLVFIAFIAILATTLGITLVYYNLFQTQVREDLRTGAYILADTGIFDSSDHTSNHVASVPTDQLHFRGSPLRITWIAGDGAVLYDNDTEANLLENHLNRPEVQQALDAGVGEIVRRSDTLNLNTFYYAMRLENGTILRVAAEARTLSSVFLAATPIIAIILMTVLVICILIGHLLTESILFPIEQMAENLEESSLQASGNQSTYKELQPFIHKIRTQHANILAAVKSRQDFTANVSHELKTPLAAISGYAELIEQHMIPAEQDSHIAKQIRGNADRLLSLINDIIELSALDHMESVNHFTTIDLKEMMQSSCDELHVNASSRNIRLSCSGIPVNITGDSDLIRELLINLVQNAIQYTNSGGHVRVSAGTEQGHPFLRVTDNGIGIPKDQQDRIFERFYRVDKSRSRETGGTGLGLAIVKHICEIHGASIRVDSEVGMGTTITIRF